jgi:hypothetical protein
MAGFSVDQFALPRAAARTSYERAEPMSTPNSSSFVAETGENMSGLQNIAIFSAESSGFPVTQSVTDIRKRCVDSMEWQ